MTLALAVCLGVVGLGASLAVIVVASLRFVERMESDDGAVQGLQRRLLAQADDFEKRAAELHSRNYTFAAESASRRAKELRDEALSMEDA